ncbi:4Fe-4S binding protein [Paenibacillus mucilaginosus]|uniref:4Fe-4S binding protein n=1 Tax=Paenibacillus mucilaginosus TaxID=61624 RepID=UPI0039B7690A
MEPSGIISAMVSPKVIISGRNIWCSWVCPLSAISVPSIRRPRQARGRSCNPMLRKPGR